MALHNALLAKDIALTAGHIASLAGIVLLGCTVTVTALGATQSAENCKDISISLKSLDTPEAGLSITLVDLPSNDAELGLVEPLDADEIASTATVPFLFLTPRVESMLREVFDDETPNENAVNRRSESHTMGGATRVAPLPRIAEGSTDQPHLSSLQETDITAADESIPRFQHSMYRTDI